MNSEPVIIDDDDVDNNTVVIIDDEVKVIERKPPSPIIIDDEPHIETKDSTAEKAFITNLRNNSLMNKIIHTCMNMPNNTGMERVIQKTLVPLYRDTNPILKRSTKLTSLLKKIHKMLLQDPDHKFLHIKTLCEELKSGNVRKKVPFVTLATNLREKDKYSDSTDAQTDLWYSEPIRETNTGTTETEVEVIETEEEINKNPKRRKRKQNIKTQGKKRKPKRVIEKQHKKICKTDKTKTDVIELDNSDNESCNHATSVEATTSITSEGSERISPNSSTGEDSNKENNDSTAEKQNNESKPGNESSGYKPQKENELEQDNNKFQHKINTIFYVHDYPVVQDPRLPTCSIPMQNPPLSINNTAPSQNPPLSINSTAPILNSLLTVNSDSMIRNPVPENNNISKTVAVIEYSASANENNLCSKDGVDIEVLIPQTHIENGCKVSNGTPNSIETEETCSNIDIEVLIPQTHIQNGCKVSNGTPNSIETKERCSENGTVTKQSRGKRKYGEVQDVLVPENCRENGLPMDRVESEKDQNLTVAKNKMETEIVKDFVVPKNPRENIIGQDLLVPKNHIDMVVSDDKPYDPNIVAFHERCIVAYKQKLAELEEQEVTDDSPKCSPYLLCAKLKEKIVESYKKICEITGASAAIAKRCEIRLNVAEGHHPGPAKQLERFLNSTIRDDGLIKFPDFEEVLQCVNTSNIGDQLGWSSQQILKEASALFVQCGQALQKRRQKREYEDLMSLVRDRDLDDDDPAEKDPWLLAKLEANKQIAKYNENDILNRFAAMENLRYPAQEGLFCEEGTVVFESDNDSSAESASEDCEDYIPVNEITSIHDTQDTPTSDHAEDTIDIRCRTPSLLKTLLFESATEYNQTNNSIRVLNGSSFENSALLNSSSQPSLVNSKITKSVQSVQRETNVNTSSPTSDNVGNSSPVDVKNVPQRTDKSLAINVTDKEVVSKDNKNCEIDNIGEENVSVTNIKKEKESIKINFSEPIDSISFIPNCNNSSTNTDCIESNIKTEPTVKPERLDVQAMLNELGDNFECTVFDIEDPFLVIEISSDDYSDDDDL